MHHGLTVLSVQTSPTEISKSITQVIRDMVGIKVCIGLHIVQDDGRGRVIRSQPSLGSKASLCMWRCRVLDASSAGP